MALSESGEEGPVPAVWKIPLLGMPRLERGEVVSATGAKARPESVDSP
jgi:hypothetical protein